MSRINSLIRSLSTFGETPYGTYCPETQEIRLVMPRRKPHDSFTFIIPRGDMFYYEKKILLPEGDYQYLQLSGEEISGVYAAVLAVTKFVSQSEYLSILGALYPTGPLGALIPVSSLSHDLRMMLWNTWKKTTEDVAALTNYCLPLNRPNVWLNTHNKRVMIELRCEFLPVVLQFVNQANGFTVTDVELSDLEKSDNWTKVMLDPNTILAIRDLHMRVDRWYRTTSDKAKLHYNVTLPNEVLKIINDFQGDGSKIITDYNCESPDSQLPAANS